MFRVSVILLIWLFSMSLGVACGEESQAKSKAKLKAKLERAEFAGDSTLEVAKRYVEKSDKYLHHSRLKRGMKGYGLTVMAGVEIVKFDVEIVSVAVSNGPHQDMILARLRGPGEKDYFTTTGIIAGMSGSPVYIKDPRDGKMKMVGAVAFGWSAQKEPIAGVQPITQMLAVSGVLPGSGVKEPMKRRGNNAPASKRSAAETKKYITRILSPTKTDILALSSGKAESKRSSNAMVPLSTPLSVTGASSQTLALASKLFGSRGLMPRTGGAVSALDAKDAAKAKLEPGSGIAVPLVTGDQNWSAIGTVTEVIGKRVLAFGHSFYSEGKCEYPMGPAYIHTIIANFNSFKMGVGLDITGTLDRDENTAVSGLLGKGPDTVPMIIKVRFGETGRTQTFRYNICKEKYFTPAFTRIMLQDAITGWCNPPLEHNCRYTVEADFGKFGKYSAANVSNGDAAGEAVGDLTRPVGAMADNPFSKSLYPKSLSAEVTVLPGDIGINMERVTTDGTVYSPGDTVTGKLTFNRYRKKRLTLDWQFKLPDDLPEGSHTIEIGDYYSQLSRMQDESPQLYDPKTAEDLFKAIQLIAKPQANVIYLAMPIDRGGLAIGKNQLPDLPEGKARILIQANLPDTKVFTRSILQKMTTSYIVNGSAKVTINVKDNPTQTLLR